MHEEPNRRACEGGDAGARPEEEREKHQMVIIDPDFEEVRQEQKLVLRKGRLADITLGPHVLDRLCEAFVDGDVLLK